MGIALLTRGQSNVRQDGRLTRAVGAFRIAGWRRTITRLGLFDRNSSDSVKASSSKPFLRLGGRKTGLRHGRGRQRLQCCTLLHRNFRPRDFRGTRRHAHVPRWTLRAPLITRFPRTVANLKAAIQPLPMVLIFDNDVLAMAFRRVAEFRNGKPSFVAEPVPEWLRALPD
jgi:hypothetical protein